MERKVKGIARRVVKSIPPLYRQYNRIRGWRIHDAETKLPYLSIGGDGGAHNYGAWVVPTNLLTRDSIVYSFGVGEDITFDLDLIERFGCSVFAYDPTPDAVSYVEHLNPDPRFRFSQVGLAAEDGVATFKSPEESDPSFTMPHMAASDELGSGDECIEFPVTRMSTLMVKNGHNRIDLLKMDIEGFEYSVIDDMLDCRIMPRCIVLEFHHYQRKDPASTRRAVERLKAVGYELFWVSELGAEYGFYLSGNSS